MSFPHLAAHWAFWARGMSSQENRGQQPAPECLVVVGGGSGEGCEGCGREDGVSGGAGGSSPSKGQLVGLSGAWLSEGFL